MYLLKIIAFCLIGVGLAAWKCGGEKRAEDAAVQPPGASATEVPPADMNVNQPADMTAPGGVDAVPGGMDPGAAGVDASAVDPAMGEPSPSDEVPVGTEGAEPGMDYTGGDQGVEAAPPPAPTPGSPAEPK